MSMKPTKKSDLNKGWIRGRDAESKRRMINPEYHLIVTEGTDTEPNYFETIRDEINKNFRDRINLSIRGEGDNTVNLFYIARAIAENNLNQFKHVWIVYDMDDFPAEHINLVEDLCNNCSTEETTYHALWSNQCIELWYLLHFAYFQSDIHRKEYWPKLTGYLCDIGKGEYKKNRKDMYYVLKPFMDKAINNAKKLADNNEGKTPADSAPGTMVYLIIEKLKPFLEFEG